MFTFIYQEIFYRPIYNFFIFLIDILPFNSVGLAIIILIIFVRVLIFPLSHKSIITQKKLKLIEPEIKKIKEKFKNKEEQTLKLLNLYKEHGISPFSGIFMLILQMPIFITLFVILKSLPSLNSEILYSFLSLPEHIDYMFLGFADLSKPYFFISLFAGISQFFQVKYSMPEMPKNNDKKPSFSNELQKSMFIQMKYIMPIFIFFVAQKFSSGLALYWTFLNVFAIFHEILVSKKLEEKK